MNQKLLKEARALAAVISQRVEFRIPSILAEGESFALRISVTGPDGMPVDNFGNLMRFERCVGVEGLPPRFTMPAGSSTAEIGGLRAIGPRTAVVRAGIDTPDVPQVTATVASNPAWVSPDPQYRVFWGDLHIHTKFSNCSPWRCLDPRWAYQYAREISLLDFAAPADHLRGIASQADRWPRLQELARQCNDPGRFVSFLAFESSHAMGFGGDNNVYYLDDDCPYFWIDRDDMRGISPNVHLRTLWEQLDASNRPYFTVPHHTGRAGKYRTWRDDCYDPSHEPLFEIYSSWGSSEMRHSRLPISGGNNDDASYFVDALQAGARFGVIASSDDHATLPGSVHQFRVDPFCPPTLNGFASKGLAAVRCRQLTRQSLFEAMRRRDTFATTHSRSLVDMTIADAGMGQEMQADASLRRFRKVRVRLTAHDAGTARVVLMRNGRPLETRGVRAPELCSDLNEIVFEDPAPLDQVVLRDAPFHPAPFAVYYARVEDSCGGHQWTSPIWLDL